MSLKALLLQAPDDQLDTSMKPLIEKWGDPATALQILEVLDQCIHGGLASGFTVSVLQIILDSAIANEDTTLAEVVKLATWRDVLAN